MMGKKYASQVGPCIVARSSLQVPRGYPIFLGGEMKPMKVKRILVLAACCGGIPLAIALQPLRLSGLGWAALRLMGRDSTALGASCQ